VILIAGASVLVVTASFALTGLPAPGGVAPGVGDAASPGPTASGAPGPPVFQAPHLTSSKRHAVAEGDLCRHGPRTLEPASVVFHGARDEKVVALTFDDGWGGRSLRRLLRVLQDKHVNATFFPVGQAVRHDPTTWKQVAAAGFPIADHTYDHGKLTGLCFATQLRELDRQADVVRDVLAADPVGLMRPPYGAKDRNTLLAATAAGDEAVVLWDVDTRDWSGLGWRQISNRALAGGRGSIVLMHTLYTTTAAALPHIIAGYKARGFQFVTVGELLGVPGPVPFG